VVTPDAVTNAVGKLRKALHDSRQQPRFIEIIAKRGYRLIPEPRLLAAHDAVPHASRAPTWGRLKGASLLLLAIVAVASLFLPLPETDHREAVRGEPLSVAVLPFDNLSSDPSQEYFVAGITHDLITDLSRQARLRVISPNAAFAYRDAPIDERAVARELGVRFLVRGAVQRSDDQLRINARLLEAETGVTLWAHRFSGAAGSVFAIQDELLSGIVDGLGEKLTGGLKPFRRGGATQSLTAYDEYLLGRDYYGRITPQDNALAMQYFGRAIELDPSFARAHAGLALTWSRHAIDGWGEDPEASLWEASRHAEVAASIDPDLPQVHFVRGQIALFLGRHHAAAVAALKAIELDPNYADGYGLLAWVMHYGGRPDKAREALSRARQLNPVSSASYEEIAGEIAFATGQYQDAVGSFRSTLQRNPTHARARFWLIAALVQLGALEDAAWEAEELVATSPNFTLSRMLFAFPHKDPSLRDSLLGAVAKVGLTE
jgi:TolB-like protein/Tfp pilus assembly protein PilF